MPVAALEKPGLMQQGDEATTYKSMQTAADIMEACRTLLKGRTTVWAGSDVGEGGVPAGEELSLAVPLLWRSRGLRTSAEVACHPAVGQDCAWPGPWAVVGGEMRPPAGLSTRLVHGLLGDPPGAPASRGAVPGWVLSVPDSRLLSRGPPRG